MSWAISSVPPAARVPNSSKTETSKLRLVEKKVWRKVSSPRVVAQVTRRLMASCATTTPLGRPVEPEVWMTYAALAGERAGDGTGLSSAARAPATTASSTVRWTPLSRRMWRRRSAGYSGSSGT